MPKVLSLTGAVHHAYFGMDFVVTLRFAKDGARLRRSDMLELPSYVRLELKVIPQQRKTPRRHDNKWIARRQTGVTRGDIRKP